MSWKLLFYIFSLVLLVGPGGRVNLVSVIPSWKGVKFPCCFMVPWLCTYSFLCLVYTPPPKHLFLSSICQNLHLSVSAQGTGSYASFPWLFHAHLGAYKGEGGNRGWDSWMVSLTQWTWVRARSGELVMDREACRPAVHEVAKSRTRLSNWTELIGTFSPHDNPVMLVLHHDLRDTKTEMQKALVLCLRSH